LWPFVLAVERRRGEALKLKNAIWAFIPSAKIICLSLLDRGDVLYAEKRNDVAYLFASLANL
jgi:hypothetical protein